MNVVHMMMSVLAFIMFGRVSFATVARTRYLVTLAARMFAGSFTFGRRSGRRATFARGRLPRFRLSFEVGCESE